MPRKLTKTLAPAVHYDRDGILALEGDMREVLAGMEAESFTACVCDPPYGLEFMGKEWDSFGREKPYRKRRSSSDDVNTKGMLPHYGRGGTSKGRATFHAKAGVAFQAWFTECARAVLRVLKPGGMLLAFGGTRTFHRMACAVEDAGFEVRDTLMWLQGQGFAKGLNIALQFEQELCERRDGKWFYTDDGVEMRREPPFRAQEADTWFGWNVAFKPAWEPIIVAMKPLDGTFAGNALKHGVAGINVDGGRVGTSEDIAAKVQAIADVIDFEYQIGREGNLSANRRYADSGSTNIAATPGPRGGDRRGRWPANVIISHSPECVAVGTRPEKGYVINRFKDGAKPFGGGAGHEYESEEVTGGEVAVWACVPGCPVRMLDEQSGSKPSSARPNSAGKKYRHGSFTSDAQHSSSHEDTGTASRFFYTAKVSTAERSAGLSSAERNLHPTVKPIDLMRYLLTLVTMPKGTRVLDPFMGSGSTLVAAKQLSLACVGIDNDPESCKTAAGRLSRRTRKGVGQSKKLRKRRRK